MILIEPMSYRPKQCLLVALWSISSVSVHAAEFPAVLDWSGRVALTLSVSGVLDSVAVQAGQRVGKGELLASLEPTQLKAAVAEARAEMDRLNAEQAESRRDLDRVRELYARTVASTTELDAANLRFARVGSGLAAAQARVERARRQLAETELRAPFDAMVLQRHAEPGLVISSQCQPAPVFTVARADELIARAQIIPVQAAGVHLGDVVEVSVADAILPGKIQAISVDSANRYMLEVSVSRSGSLSPGQAASIRLK